MGGLKPIEPGCRVMYIGRCSEQVGATGTAGEFFTPDTVLAVVGGRTYSVTRKSWQVFWDRPFNPTHATIPGLPRDTRGPHTELLMDERALMRIDGDVEDESEADEVSKVKEIAHEE